MKLIKHFGKATVVVTMENNHLITSVSVLVGKDERLSLGRICGSPAILSSSCSQQDMDLAWDVSNATKEAFDIFMCAADKGFILGLGFVERG